MAIKLNLNDAQKEQLVEFYRSEIKKIDQQKREYIDLINQITGDQVRAAKNQLPLINSEPKSYSADWSWSLKAHYILSKENQFLTAREILDKIIVLEPSLKEKERDNYRYLSSTISAKVAEKKTFGRHSIPDKKVYVVGLIEWYDKNGQPKQLSS